ncbi:deoxyguanosinetriphosphate triphosphohydrolase [Amnibacterium kyonggiense]|uniref:Deoxyguanosinetriphosphate triphosphohydrolase-like protein n=1 Tax=Amnibacterium kyonggiense TaxID=595671 RepID=A0A4R7FMD0_9MICO|nr:deoxyguanosinetriphosphate triphosphohydrolase [Amnibacterium kyonggiense]TDS77593.1 dGTPase [Amnibacterium kyonggiense]
MGDARDADLGYGESDRDRWLPEDHSSRRSDFARDRARLLHSGALRRLAAKTQVLSPTLGLDFARTRLTHSLEVAQVGRELAGNLGLAPDVVDTACLAHDLGHPPFGHNGERALNEWSAGIGGFEGNAQSLRLLTRLEPKVFGPDDQPYGLNLTRASLDASLKYPWGLDAPVGDPSGRAKFGYYPEDEAAFAWLRSGAPPRRPCIEAQVMDLSDDIAYSVHDFEDAVVGGSVDLAALRSNASQRDVVGAMWAWVGGAFDQDELVEALHRLRAMDSWIVEWDGSRRAHAALKNLTSQLIGRFSGAATTATRRAHPGGDLVRFNADVVVPRGIEAEIAALKGIVAAFVMANDDRRPVYVQQRELLQELADALHAAPQHLDTAFSADWAAAEDDRARQRVIVDQVASLTDQSALAWHGRLVR